MIFLSFAFREKTEMIRSYIQEVVQYIKRVCHADEYLSLLQTMYECLINTM